MTARKILRVLLAINAVAAFAAACVLAIAPAAIPATVGVILPPSANLLAYLLAATELGLAVLALLPLVRGSDELMVASIIVLIVTHLASAIAGLAVVGNSANGYILLNVAVRIIMVVALTTCGISHLRSRHRDPLN